MLVRQIRQNPAMPPEWLVRRVPLDVQRYVEASRSRCFICALNDREFGYEHHVILDTADTIASRSVPARLPYEM